MRLAAARWWPDGFDPGFFMTQMEHGGLASPWATLWLSPRQTIERIVAIRPTYLVWPLAMLGSIAGFYVQLLTVGFSEQFVDWRLWLGFVIAAGVFGIVWLYPSALILSWIGRWLGGGASTLQLRAVLAWSTVPTILGFLIALAVSFALEASGRADAWGGRLLVAMVFELWSIIVFLLMLACVQHFGFWRTIAVYVLNAMFALALAMFVRSLLYQPFNVPASSMVPTVLVGDYVFASKFAYGYSRFSLPFSPPLFPGRILASEPKRGDVVVFRLPKDERTDYVKRVVGLPGERIEMKDGLLYIDAKPVAREQLTDYVGDACGTGSAAMTRRWRETLPNGASYETLDCIDNGFYDNTSAYTVPPGHYFMLGDNRDNSTDSRALSAVGYIPLDNLIGRVDLIFFSRAPGSDGAPARVRSARIGTVVR
ncbi:signal peptidase I [Bradyrhizobium sp.]|uniref:signal peptidase I n=1 Tax=Bradyrhizobium sp. TaxID=376 RepID=UPI003BAE18C3